MNTTNVTRRAAWTAVAAVFALNGVLFGMWVSRIPAVQAKLGLSHSALGIVLLFLGAGAVLAFPVTGRFIDRFGAVTVTRIVATSCTLSVLLMGLAPNIYTLALALLIFGAFHGAVDVAMNAWGAEVERDFDRSMMSSFHAMWSLGAGLGAISGALAVWAGLGVITHFTFGAVLFGSLTFVVARIPWESEKSEFSQSVLFALPKGVLILVGLLSMCAAVGEGVVADWGAIYLRDVAGASESWAAIGFGSFSVAMVIVRLLGDALIRKFGPVASARAGGACATSGALLVLLATAPVTGIVGFTLLGIGFAVIVPLAFSRAANDPNIPPGQALASVATLGYGGMLLGPPIIGFVADLTSLRLSFILLFLLSATILLYAGALRRAD
ncbi:MAG: MFS transporter [Pseudomonadota bacterium]